MNVVYIITVSIILLAAGYNIFCDSEINFGIEVKDKDYFECFPLNLRQNLKKWSRSVNFEYNLEKYRFTLILVKFNKFNWVKSISLINNKPISII